jgi:hypothetical protein
MENIAAILASGGMTLDDVLTVTCYLTDISDWPAMNKEYAWHYGADQILPARTAIAVAALPMNLRIEIGAVKTDRPCRIRKGRRPLELHTIGGFLCAMSLTDESRGVCSSGGTLRRGFVIFSRALQRKAEAGRTIADVI